MAWLHLKELFQRLFRTSSTKSANSTLVKEVTPECPVSPNEPIARFVTREDRIHWAAIPPTIKEKQFEPDKKYNEVSCLRIEYLDEPATCALGTGEVCKKETDRILGWGRFTESLIKQPDPNLHLDPKPDPDFPTHARHVNLRGWPKQTEADWKARRNSIMQYLAEHVSLQLSQGGRETMARKQAAR